MVQSIKIPYFLKKYGNNMKQPKKNIPFKHIKLKPWIIHIALISNCRKKPSKRHPAGTALLAEAHLPAEGPDLREEEAVRPFRRKGGIRWKLHGWEMTEENTMLFFWGENHRNIRENPSINGWLLMGKFLGKSSINGGLFIAMFDSRDIHI